ncbi:hypothetical protein P152DRAFT_306899 [Eremomyces bilateralis CBS 781.70]|uniref:R3H domain protein n=1 Tax=Eremomyces bilateralis CBS 781.70 TaxID=1392243 RepID=A0A6G1G5E2_9PEZI|nr:uncharacterized protein P152DRAFT_306899 [Eremomyces bilateralis CBS 781.70]KAF1813156.1 hypothetical protein P152DRAFT_306899 [Eremomyces bilateralis CBS 781.70]
MNNPNDYFDNPASRSPGSLRHPNQTLHRQPSRQFDAYGQAAATYIPEDMNAQPFAHRFNERMNPTMQPGYYDLVDNQTWNGVFPSSGSMPAINSRRNPPMHRGGRAGLPTTWMEGSGIGAPIPNFGGVGNPPLSMAQRPNSDMNLGSNDDELIPTAIVIKNIPFAVKKEQLVQLMTDLGLPLPYAFNYHFDNGVFRGLAFANFTNPHETAAVIQHLNHYELQGRKLRVEYKKMLPIAERERIEREKRERRGQLEEQHRPLPAGQLHNQSSLSSLGGGHLPTTSPSPVNQRNLVHDVDMNDPTVLRYYSQILLFKEDLSRDTISFSPQLAPTERRVVHTLAHHMGLSHNSQGEGDSRRVVVTRVALENMNRGNMSPPGRHSVDPRRTLNRAATTDFTDVRAGEGFYNTIGRQSSGLLGGYPDSPAGLGPGPNLRPAKSYADLRSYTPSPVPSTASFPINLNTNLPRFSNDPFTSAVNSQTSMTPTAGGRDDLVNGMGSMTLTSSTLAPSGSPRRGILGWNNDGANPGPIGGHRAFSTNFDASEGPRDRGAMIPARQPRGPVPERGSGYGNRPRQNGHVGRGSDELSNQSGKEIAVE